MREDRYDNFGNIVAFENAFDENKLYRAKIDIIGRYKEVELGVFGVFEINKQQ